MGLGNEVKRHFPSHPITELPLKPFFIFYSQSFLIVGSNDILAIKTKVLLGVVDVTAQK